MQIKSKKCIYLPEEKYFSFREKLDNGVQVRTYLLFSSDKFLDYQKDLIQDFIGDLMDKCQGERADIEEIKTSFEIGLQNLNTKLKLFADKVRDVDYFPIKGFIQIVIDNILMASMIGDTTILIFRDKKLYYQLHNGIDNRAKIDLFSDFIEGDLQKHDEILYAGLKVTDVIDNTDIKEMESVLETEETSILDVMEQILTARVDATYIGFMMYYVITGASAHNDMTIDSQKRLNTKFANLKRKKNIFSNKYYLTIGVLSIVIIFMLSQLIKQLFNTSNTDTFRTDSGEIVDITIDDIKKDIYLFQSMDPTSDEKGIKYNEVLSKLNTLETKGRRLEDVRKLKTIIEADYYKGFNIVHVKTLSQFDDLATGIKTQLLTLNTVEKTKLGTPREIYVDKDITIAGTQAALVGSVNDSVR